MGTQGTPKHPGLRPEWPMSAYQAFFVNDSDEVGLRPGTQPTDDAMRRSAEHAPPLYAGSSYGGG
jgi:hypothetical protein